MADANVGFLREDWVTNTRNGLPAFRGLVFLIYWLGLPQLSYVFWITLTGIFAVGMFGLARSLQGQKTLADCMHFDRSSFIFSAFFILTNFGLLTKLWWGVAQQHLLGPALEPSHFATLFPLAILLYVTERRVAALLCTIPIGLFHPGYIIPVAVLLAGFVIADRANLRRFGVSAWAALALAFIVLAAHALYLQIHFMPTSPELAERASTILTEKRIPEQAMVARWLFTWGSAARIVAVLLAMWFARKHAVGRILLVAFAGIVALTLFQVLTGNHLLALIAPWRTSIWVVPLSVIVLLGTAAQFVDHQLERPELGVRMRLPVAALLVLLSAAAALEGANAKIKDFRAPQLAGYEIYLKNAASPHTLYLVPTDLSKIRIDTLAPIYITGKSHPYQDYEVLEWYRRTQVVDALYKPEVVDCGALRELTREAHLTHMLVTRFDQTVNCSFAKLVYLDAEARIYALKL
ncbi:MAG: hypothetical protein HY243_01595 [Proteobacteria bacterium]|nr:hypothetical protein [Pseudomonadota bacterium]